MPLPVVAKQLSKRKVVETGIRSLVKINKNNGAHICKYVNSLGAVSYPLAPSLWWLTSPPIFKLIRMVPRMSSFCDLIIAVCSLSITLILFSFPNSNESAGE